MASIGIDALGVKAQDIIREELTALRDRIAANIVAVGAKASGRTIESLEVQVTPAEGGGWQGVLLGRPFFGALETGSSRWSKQYAKPPKFFVEIIQQWIDDKGLDMSAFLVARKIMREGTALKREGGRDTVYSREIPVTLDAIAERLATYWATVAVQNITLNTK